MDDVRATRLAPRRRARLPLGWAPLPALGAQGSAPRRCSVGVWQAYVSVQPRQPPALRDARGRRATTFGTGWADGSLAGPTWTTLRILLEGIGIGVGDRARASRCFATLSTFGTDLLELLTSVFNPLPGVAVLPLAMLWFGIDDERDHLHGRDRDDLAGRDQPQHRASGP